MDCVAVSMGVLVGETSVGVLVIMAVEVSVAVSEAVSVGVGVALRQAMVSRSGSLAHLSAYQQVSLLVLLLWQWLF